DVDTGWSIGVDSKGDALVTGQTFSTNFPMQMPFQANCDNCSSFIGSSPSGDSFLVKVCITSCPSASPAPASLSFASQNVGTTSAAQSVTFTNNGSGDLTIVSVTVTGADAADFSQTNNCPSLLIPATACQVNVTFTPTVGGNRAANVSITNNGGTSPQLVGLSGTGVAPVPVVGLAPGSLNFGNQTQNTTSAAQGITVTNNGPGTLTITGIAITGANPGDFGQTNNCPVSPATLVVNATCTINATFTPTATGARAASVSITDNGTGSPQSAALSGTGTPGVITPWPNGYTYQATFTVASGKAPGAQTNFPALISGTYPDFRSGVNGGRIVNSCTQTVGNRAITVPCDLIFTADAAGSTLLSWEIESYNPTTGALVAWLNVPSLSSGAVVYGWYGNAAVSTLQYTPTSTWNSNYLGVWHFSEDPSGTPPQMNDSTPGFSSGTLNGAMAGSDQVPGMVGGSLAFGSGKYVTFADPAMFSLERTSAFTLEAWVKFKAKESSGILMKELGSGNFTGYGIFQRAGNTNSQIACDATSITGSSRAAVRTNNEWALGTFHHVVCVYAGTSMASGFTVYVDGVVQPTTTLSDNLTGSLVNSAALEVSGRGGATFQSTATIDEPRVSKSALPAGWIAAEYNNQNNPATFFTAVAGLTNSGLPGVGLAPNSLNFGNQTQSTTSAAQSITVTNNGPGALTITGIALTGANPGDFGQTNNCPVSPATLAVNATCTINATFTPTATGTRAAAVSITDNGTGSPQLVGLSGTGVAPAPPPWPNGYMYQATFTVATGKVPSTQTNFPVLISGTFADLKSFANGGRVLNTCTQIVGTSAITVPCDLIFTSDAAGVSPVSWEFESYNAATGAVIVWVNVPSLSSGSVIYGWYGNSAVTTPQTTPSSTWSADFVSVYHMKENPAGMAPQINDSTVSAINAGAAMTIPAGQQEPGEIGGSIDMNRSYYFNLGTASTWSFERTDSFSVSCWCLTTSNNSGSLLTKQQSSGAFTGWEFFARVGTRNPTFALDLSNNAVDGANRLAVLTPELAQNTWHHVVATYSGASTPSSVHIYVDGTDQPLTTLVNTLTGSILSPVAPNLGSRSSNSSAMPGKVDEARVYATGVVLSPGWVTTEYNNQSSPSTFFSVTTGLTNP
ncbi:MAG TPA: choice-of-anchor D domain-containing protein, partial [Bryobacteraceae bacterium]